MESLLLMRKAIIRFVKNNELWIVPILKFIGGFIVFSAINDLGYAKMLDKNSVVLLVSALTAVVPPTWVFAFMSAFVTIHVFYASIELSVLVGMFLLLILFFFVRIFPKYSIMIIVLLFCYKAGIPYFVPIFAGMFMGIGAIVPIMVGVLIWSLLPQFGVLVAANSGSVFSIMSLPDTFGSLYISFVNALTANPNWVYSALVFCVVIIIESYISKLSINYSHEIALGIGGAVTLLGFLMATLYVDLDVNIGGLIGGTLLSVAVVEILNFFRAVLDYQRSERIEFQDDDNYYFVKIVPKIRVERSKPTVKRISDNVHGRE